MDKKALGYFSKSLLLCSTEERKTYSFETTLSTSESKNRIFHFGNSFSTSF